MSTLKPRLRRALIPVGLSLLSLSLAGCAGAALTTPTSWPGLTVSGSTAYLAYTQAVHAIDLEDGSEIWRFPSKAERSQSFFAPPAVAEDGLVIVGGFDNAVYALQPQGNAVDIAWTFEQAKGRFIGGATITGDLALLPCADGVLYALGLATGRQEWTFKADAALWSTPLVDGDRLFITSLDHHVYALSVADGRELWRADLSSAIPNNPVLSGDSLLIGTFGNRLVSLDPETGAERWSFTDADGWIWGSPTVGDGVAYFGDLGGTLHAVNLDDGNEVWRLPNLGPIVATPVLSDGSLYAVTETGVVLARETSDPRPLWSADPQIEGGRLLTTPIVIGDTILVTAVGTDCLLFTVDAGLGSLRCLFQPAS